MKNENNDRPLTRIHFNTNNGEKIFGALNVNIAEFLRLKNNNYYFLTKENNVVWCDLEMFERIFIRYIENSGSNKLPQALVEAKFNTNF